MHENVSFSVIPIFPLNILDRGRPQTSTVGAAPKHPQSVAAPFRPPERARQAALCSLGALCQALFYVHIYDDLMTYDLAETRTSLASERRPSAVLSQYFPSTSSSTRPTTIQLTASDALQPPSIQFTEWIESSPVAGEDVAREDEDDLMPFGENFIEHQSNINRT